MRKWLVFDQRYPMHIMHVLAYKVGVIFQIVMLNYFAREEPRARPQARIKEIPNFNSPQRISQLNFSHNQIRSIPPHITTALHLQILDLSHNKITKIQHIYRITGLKFLNLSHNLVAEVPPEMTQMVEVQNIDLSFNRIAILNNIKVLKQLAEIRIFDFQGFIEVNLEGNQILKKKGCKEIYKKWMNPSKEDYQRRSRQDSRDGYIHLTKKRNSKSLELPLREHSMMTQRIHIQKMEETKCFDHKKKEEKLGSNLKKSIQMTEKLSPNFANSEERSDMKDNPLAIKSQILNSFHNYKDLSKIYESVTIQDVNNIAEWFSNCMEELNDLNHKFQLSTSNEDFNSLNKEVRKMLNEESAIAIEIIALCLRAIKEAVDNKLGKEIQSKLFGEIATLDGRIKELHLQILKTISGNTEHLPIKVYKIWVSLYRKLKVIITMIPQKIDMHKFSYLREQQIQQLLSISPDKNKLILPSQQKQETVKHSSGNKLSASKDKLNDLLFSNKSECLLLSDNKDFQTSSEKKHKRKVSAQKEECENCLMLKWLNTKIKEELAELHDKIIVLERDNQQSLENIKMLQKFKEKYLVLADKQDIIIGQLEYLKPSTYQNLMLEQAKAIQYMLKTGDLVDFKQLNSMPKEANQQQLREYTSKQMEKDKSFNLNTRLSSSKNCKENSNCNKISEFSVQGKKEMITKESSNANRGSSYFKHKNIITTINRTNDDQKTQIVGQYMASQESRPKNEPNNRQQVVVSQFNSHLNSAEKSSGMDKHITFENFATENNLSREFAKNHRKITEKSNGNDVILISEGTDIKNISISKKSSQKMKVEHASNKKNTFQYLKSQEFNTLLREKLMHEQSMNKQALKAIKQGSNKQKTKQSIHRQSKRINSDLSDKQNTKPGQLKRNKTSDRLYEDSITHSYIPMDSQQAQSYKRYMKYHLRNNIIKILYKKNSGGIESESQKYPQMSKNQKLISKPNITKRSESEGGLSKRSQINRTFR